MNGRQLEELLYQMLETEMGGVKVYETAIRCAVNPDLKKEWKEYKQQTVRHEQVVRGMIEKLEFDPDAETPGRLVIRGKAAGLVEAMELALTESPEAAQLVAAECIVEAETKDHLNWELLKEVSKHVTGVEKKLLIEATESIENQEDEHLYHTAGWVRELWLESLGLPAVLPPPEEEKKVTTAIGAARAQQQREKMLEAK